MFFISYKYKACHEIEKNKLGHLITGIIHHARCIKFGSVLGRHVKEVKNRVYKVENVKGGTSGLRTLILTQGEEGIDILHGLKLF